MRASKDENAKKYCQYFASSLIKAKNGGIYREEIFRITGDLLDIFSSISILSGIPMLLSPCLTSQHRSTIQVPDK